MNEFKSLDQAIDGPEKHRLCIPVNAIRFAIRNIIQFEVRNSHNQTQTAICKNLNGEY
jgi:hypothetical protein